MVASGSFELLSVSFKQRFPSSAVLSVISTSELSFISPSDEAKLALAFELEDPLKTDWLALFNILPSRATLTPELSKESRP